MKTEIKEFDSSIRAIVPENIETERLAAGFGFTEGPLWYGDCFLFSDLRNNRIIRLRMLSNGPEVTTFRSPSGGSNGLTLDRGGRLIACEHDTRRVTRTEIDGTVSVIAGSYNGKRLNSPNDIVVRSDGSVYFTDPTFGLGTPPKWQELGYSGLYRVKPDGELELLADDFNMCNGLAFSPDESILYVNDTRERHIRAFDVSPYGGISNSRVFVKLEGEGFGAPDGMKVDTQGNVYCTGPGGIWVMNSEGKALGIISLPDAPANFGWGDKDFKSLYITARPCIYRLRLNIPGIPVIR